jgi:ligand-binding sensor protein
MRLAAISLMCEGRPMSPVEAFLKTCHRMRANGGLGKRCREMAPVR